MIRLSSRWNCAVASGSLAAMVFVAGCSGKTAGGAGGGEDLIAAGKTVYASQNCSNCHKLGDQGQTKAPELTHVGAEATHTAQWISDHVKNPKTHNPGSRMPFYDGKIAEKDLTSLGTYLASLK